ncbi:MAG: DUF2683 family protein [Nanoarchaeota archaeon]
MTQMLVKLEEHEDRVLTIVKGKYGLKNKSDAVKFVIDKFEMEMLEPALRPEYAEKLDKIKKQKGVQFKSMAEFRKHIENA